MDNCTIASFPSKSVIKQEAGAWIVKIDSAPLTPEQNQQLQQWMSTSDFHKQYLEKLAKNWDAMAILQELADLFPLQSSATNSNPLAAANAQPWVQPVSLIARLKSWLNITTANNSSSVWQGSAIASAILIATAALFIFSQPQTHFETQVGQQARYQLPDGSTLTLNTNSELDIDYSDERRVIRLHRGEANFEVAKNPQRPFVVYAGDGMVWAVGTAFNVRYQNSHSPGDTKSAKNVKSTNSKDNSQSIDVMVTEGTIKVYADIRAEQPLSATQKNADSTQTTNSPQPIKEALVNAGKTLSYSNAIDNIAHATPLQLEQQIAWQQGSILFDGETLEQAIKEISRYTNKELLIADPAIKTIRIGGHYKTNDIGALLATLSQGFDLQVTQTAAGRIELSRKAGTNTPKNE